MTIFIIIIDRDIHQQVDTESHHMDRNVKTKTVIGITNQTIVIEIHHMKIGKILWLQFCCSLRLEINEITSIYFIQIRYNQQNRYDYRPVSGGYDRNEYRQNYQDYRGNGYDNRDPMYFTAMKGGNRGYGNRENPYESNYDGSQITLKKYQEINRIYVVNYFQIECQIEDTVVVLAMAVKIIICDQDILVGDTTKIDTMDKDDHMRDLNDRIDPNTMTETVVTVDMVAAAAAVTMVAEVTAAMAMVTAPVQAALAVVVAMEVIEVEAVEAIPMAPTTTTFIH